VEELGAAAGVDGVVEAGAADAVSVLAAGAFVSAAFPDSGPDSEAGSLLLAA